MSVMIRKFLEFIATYFIVFVGLIFIFVIGAIFAFLRPEGILIKAIFLIILVGWVVYQIKYFWELLDKRKENQSEEESTEMVETNNEIINEE